MGLLFGKGQKVLFIGDSITDCGRKDIPLGVGYVRMAAGLLVARYPERGLECVNMGIGGNTVRSLAARWDADVVAQDPDWVSVSIGINDVWQQVNNPAGGVHIEEFEKTYRELIDRTRRTRARLILMQTTVIGENPADRGNALLKPYNDLIDRLAAEYKTVLVPMNREWTRTITDHSNVKWTSDGVHPLPAGHALMARVWLATVGFKW